jgi:hypothetical protein
MVYEYLFKNKGFFYLCGTAGSSIDACKAAVVKAGIEVGGLSREESFIFKEIFINHFWVLFHSMLDIDFMSLISGESGQKII